MSELKNIRTLEKKLSTTLTPLKLKDIGGSKPGYFLNSNSKISGLNLAGLGLEDIPEEMLKLNSIVQLNLGENKLKELPEQFSNLIKLETIGLYRNNFESFPYDLFEYPKIKHIYIQSNQIKSIDKDILAKSKIQSIDIRDNQLNIPPEFLQRGAPTKILTYLNSIGEDSKPFNELKVILVGDGAAGKTSLVRRLISDRYNSREPQTHGIKINPWVCDIETKEECVKFNFWDFGGQEIMHATHQFFMSKRSIYILVLNAREEPNPEYWLKSIQSYGGDSPIMIVINKIDENPAFDLNRNFLLDKYPSIIGFYRTSCSRGEGIHSVKNDLYSSVKNIPHLSNVWAKDWFNIKLALESIKEPYISYDKYVDICKEEKVEDSLSQDVLLEFLNDLGVILHFKDFSLIDTHVLDPLWVTGAVYRIINSHILSDGGGIITYDDLTEILKTRKDDKFSYPPNKYKYIIDLMKKFQLCYEIDSQTILVPDLLPIQEPDLSIYQSDGQAMVTVDYDFLPKSILPRIIVNLNKDIIDGKRWRTGVVLEDTKLGAIAIIKADYDTKRITISAIGDRKRDYLSIILHFVRKINSNFKKLDYTERIPLPDNPEINVSIEHLYRLESNGYTKYIPEGADSEYSIKTLLGAAVSKMDGEKEIMQVLEKISDKMDSTESLLQKANEIVQLQPNFFGLGVNLNALVDRFLKNKKTNTNIGSYSMRG